MTDPVIITAREIYNVVVQTGGKVDVLVTQVSAMQQSQSDHESRIRSLERGRWKLPGVSMGISVIAALATLLSVIAQTHH